METENKKKKTKSGDREQAGKILKRFSQTYINHLMDQEKETVVEDVFHLVDAFLLHTPTLPIPTLQGLYDVLDKESARGFAEYLADEPGQGTFINLPYIFKLILGVKRPNFILRLLGTADLSFLEDRKKIREFSPRYRNDCADTLAKRVNASGILELLQARLDEHYQWEQVYALLKENPKIREASSITDEQVRSIRMLRQHMLQSIPDNYIDLYPGARLMKRKFYLHIGPTNSGKTYQAIKALEKAEHGVYLGPLRLLAYEQYETMNYDGCPCNLLTGEEEIQVPFARVQSSTIEMVNIRDTFDIAVIDEAQMLQDEERGGYWSQAILGLMAKEIHVCAAPYAEKILIQMITDCGDAYEVEHLGRLVPLEADSRRFRFPEGIEEGDALILFSRKDVHACAAELASSNLPCSIIYGTLPYDVRHSEARKFSTGQTKVLIATDAIGMGLNLPIKRVVFLRQDKFDGKERRPLKPQEIQQIAGRAGRYGRYEIGSYTSFNRMDQIEAGAEADVPDIHEAVIGFPTSLLSIDAPVSEILTRWRDIPPKEGYRIMKCDEEIEMAIELEAQTQDKQLIYDFVTIPVDTRSMEIMELWRDLADLAISHRPVDFYDLRPEVNFRDYSAKNMERLETAYKMCDVLYAFFRKFGYVQYLEPTMRFKDQIASTIILILGKENYSHKTCRRCGRSLSFLSTSNICDKCFDRMRKRKPA
ncbi:MAG: helicase [Firmicutes bacterium]|nr:helicase [Bacillota bacterium]